MGQTSTGLSYELSRGEASDVLTPLMGVGIVIFIFIIAGIVVAIKNMVKKPKVKQVNYATEMDKGLHCPYCSNDLSKDIERTLDNDKTGAHQCNVLCRLCGGISRWDGIMWPPVMVAKLKFPPKAQLKKTP